MKTKRNKHNTVSVSKLDPNLFFLAAALLDNNLNGDELETRFCCNAIAEVYGIDYFDDDFDNKRDRLPENRFFAKLFEPTELYDINCMGGWWSAYDIKPRIIALLLAYHIAREGGLG